MENKTMEKLSKMAFDSQFKPCQQLLPPAIYRSECPAWGGGVIVEYFIVKKNTCKRVQFHY